MSSTEIKVKAQTREELGTSASRRMRRAGRVPAVVYGHGQAAKSVSLAVLDAKALLHHPGMLTLEIEGGEVVKAILKDYQLNVLSGNVVHVDFQEVRADEAISATLLLESTGEPVGTATGGVLEQLVHEIEISCLPGELVETVKVDVSALDVDGVLHAGDIVLPEGMSLLSDAEQSVFSVRIPRTESEDEEEGDSAEPEVIGKAAEEA